MAETYASLNCKKAFAATGDGKGRYLRTVVISFLLSNQSADICFSLLKRAPESCPNLPYNTLVKLIFRVTIGTQRVLAYT